MSSFVSECIKSVGLAFYLIVFEALFAEMSYKSEVLNDHFLPSKMYENAQIAFSLSKNMGVGH
jgi:hypothetical protein